LFSEREMRGREFTESFLKGARSGAFYKPMIVYIELEIVK
jgi:hypothetical protein